MAFKWPQRALMRRLDYSIKKDAKVAKAILEHDPRMISYIYNYDFELIKPLLNKSVSIFKYIDLSSAKNENEMVKILEHSYSLKKIMRKEIMNTIAHFYNDSIDSFFRDDDPRKNFSLLPKTMKSLILKVIKDNPMYLLVIRHDVIEKLFKFLEVDLKEFASNISFKKEGKRLIDLYQIHTNDKYKYADPIYNYEFTRLFGRYYSIYSLTHHTKEWSGYADIFLTSAQMIGKMEELKEPLLLFKI
jgi:hypothetical protein